MKLSETPQEIKTERHDYINTRWAQLNLLSKEISNRAVNFLLLTNSGGAIAMLSFLGAVPSIRAQFAPKLALAFFVIGIILVGVHTAIWIHFVDGLFSNWRKDVVRYYEDEIAWEKLTGDDDARAYKTTPLYVVGYASFSCFILGSAMGLLGSSFL